MKIIELEPDFILDEDSETEIIHIYEVHEDIALGFFYAKYKYLSYDFKGNKIKNKDDYIRTKSIWHINLRDKIKNQVIPFGSYDINIIGNYLYFTQIIDKDDDGLLKDDYYHGDIYRVNIYNHQVEFCCCIEPYIFHGFEAASEQFLVFRSEDRIPNIEEIVFVDLVHKQKAVLLNDWHKGEMGYRFISDEHGIPIYVLTKRYVDVREIGSDKDKLGCFNWTGFLNKLEWSKYL
ncbi:hypothetical protein OXPF_24440 [Oxobacter pfennigii]|uniref:DUF5050 domain-containing protein n=1 Tax=Oxobacter pfennigii TaxID=36849 RepID=A0A0P8YB56_9CLOT|nr:hypothetical protein [Oxobacter pfennigii]KPU44276.1 hypothetical protein OXPF_24440 [Oxobacter pfennigii]